MKKLLVYKQEPTCHDKWVTTVNGCLSSPIFDVCRFDDDQRAKLVGLASYIVSMYVPSLLLIHLKLTAAEALEITISRQNLLLAYCKINLYFSKHAEHWLTPI